MTIFDVTPDFVTSARFTLTTMSELDADLYGGGYLRPVSWIIAHNCFFRPVRKRRRSWGSHRASSGKTQARATSRTHSTLYLKSCRTSDSCITSCISRNKRTQAPVGTTASSDRHAICPSSHTAHTDVRRTASRVQRTSITSGTRRRICWPD
jgi:hypothetical protein